MTADKIVVVGGVNRALALALIGCLERHLISGSGEIEIGRHGLCDSVELAQPVVKRERTPAGPRDRWGKPL
ncbi:hypothetical protein K32_48860 [Kaistia sp. 32K]|uniref:hypothetical protein n=1 Tax=Kaistia sp. 32K TaxID=2795690 RepID=UPI001916B68E|nr:hypothetical protein [Kaistia sp. 32K]BCP56269.1 hypothetical protein K32_48860 [Kaistia sp. 32K]